MSADLEGGADVVDLPRRPFTVVASVGTFFRPFDRFVEWLERWASEAAVGGPVRIVLQHGATRPAQLDAATDAVVVNHEMLPMDELLALYRDADVVLLQGGTGGIMDARSCGRMPVVVPRSHASEIVDDHQVVCTAKLDELGLLHRATDYDTLAALLDAARRGSLETRTSPEPAGDGAQASVRFLADLPPRRGTRERIGRMGTVLRRRSRRAAS